MSHGDQNDSSQIDTLQMERLQPENDAPYGDDEIRIEMPIEDAQQPKPKSSSPSLGKKLAFAAVVSGTVVIIGVAGYFLYNATDNAQINEERVQVETSLTGTVPMAAAQPTLPVTPETAASTSTIQQVLGQAKSAQSDQSGVVDPVASSAIQVVNTSADAMPQPPADAPLPSSPFDSSSPSLVEQPQPATPEPVAENAELISKLDQLSSALDQISRELVATNSRIDQQNVTTEQRYQTASAQMAVFEQTLAEVSAAKLAWEKAAEEAQIAKEANEAKKKEVKKSPSKKQPAPKAQVSKAVPTPKVPAPVQSVKPIPTIEKQYAFPEYCIAGVTNTSALIKHGNEKLVVNENELTEIGLVLSINPDRQLVNTDKGTLTKWCDQ
ncbi:hypothetical protein C4K68_09515 [Pokkaliibacter plantistimulans]|uniref:Uncharacterized protein n=1 Tax=Proteobacteria bacterium 228 TaxID=2083153 RepID=A0A2S5KS56_9PROT|nr:hypothetical protein [Pokkaliibacter plantistimulans]PPC77588.1 hypothetical protein C4K68_09515 [Pokkaliibacter plantistimulans]